ncbi:MAG TPA: hypothetical protein PKH91_11180 [Flavobacterium sp.]|nr:hypothetical protein [Flavobacterium sp.]
MRLLLFALLFSSFLHSQKFDGYVVTNANDTINCKYFVPTNPFDKKLLSVARIDDKIEILSDKGEKIEYTTKEIKSFLIKGTKFGDLKFVSLKYDDFYRFYHEVQVGRLIFYRYYMEGSGMVVGIGFGLKDEKFVELQGPDIKQRLGELIIDYPELYAKWTDGNKYYKPKHLEEVIKLYNEHFKK